MVRSSTLLSRIQSFDISLNSVPIPCSSFIKILGVHVDSSWIFEPYVPVGLLMPVYVFFILFATSFPAFKNFSLLNYSLFRYFTITRCTFRFLINNFYIVYSVSKILASASFNAFVNTIIYLCIIKDLTGLGCGNVLFYICIVSRFFFFFSSILLYISSIFSILFNTFFS